VSLERDTFPSWVERRFYGYRTPAAFLDIGTPESYARAPSFFREFDTAVPARHPDRTPLGGVFISRKEKA
jgi:NDP-sugar pyrophosphorylase family protein